jgi:probable phosphoglycerate mutase
MTIIGLIRHGSTDWNSQRLIQGQTDIPLSHKGFTEIHSLASQLAAEDWHRIYCSNLERARQSAFIIAEQLHIPVSVEPALRERNFGSLEGKRYEYARAILDEPEESGKVNGLEPLDIFQKRVKTSLLKIATTCPNQGVLVVTHGGVINHFIRGLGFQMQPVVNSSLTRVIWNHNDWHMPRYD